MGCIYDLTLAEYLPILISKDSFIEVCIKIKDFKIKKTNSEPYYSNVFMYIQALRVNCSEVSRNDGGTLFF